MNTCSIVRRRLLAGLAAFGLLTGVGAVAGAQEPLQEPLNVVATTAQVGDLVANIAGDDVAVDALMGPGVDPHLFQPARSDIVRLTGADLVVYNGLDLEGRMEDALERLSAQVPVIAVADFIDPGRLMRSVTYADAWDPHVWHDVRLWAAAAEPLAGELATLLPDSATALAENAAVYSGELRELHEYVAGVLATIPEDRRVLVTAHDAFGYFGQAYGLEVVGIQGISTDSEAGLRRIEEIVDLLVTREIAAVFVETSVSERNVAALIEGAAARGHTVAVGGTLYSDAMGQPGSYEGTYIGMIDHNATVIANALGGQAPAGGMNGRLAVAGQ